MAGVQRRWRTAATSCRDCDSAHHLNVSQPASLPAPTGRRPFCAPLPSLPGGSPCRGEDVTGVHPGLAVHLLMLRILSYASLGLERRGDLDVAITRRLPMGLGLSDPWSPERSLGNRLDGDHRLPDGSIGTFTRVR